MSPVKGTRDEGWRVEIDGLEARLEPVDLSLMAVVVPAGNHVVVVRYHDAWLRAGRWLSW